MTQEFSRFKWGSLKLLRIWCPQDVVGIGAEPIVLSYTVLAHTCAVFVLVLLVLLSSLLYSGYLYLFVMFHNCYLLLVLWHQCYGYYCYCYLLLFVTPTIGAETEAARRSWSAEKQATKGCSKLWLLSGKMVEEAEWMLRQFVFSHKNIWKHITHIYTLLSTTWTC